MTKETKTDLSCFIDILHKLESGDSMICRTTGFHIIISEAALYLIKNPYNWTPDQIQLVDIILRISNLMYNNLSDETLPLDDGVYDQLSEIYKKYNPNYQVGAMPVSFIQEQAPNEIEDEKIMCTIVDKNKYNESLYLKDLHSQNTPLTWPLNYVNMVFIARDPISKRLINTKHKYPELVGTLDKCKFVLNNDAVKAGVIDQPSISVFERDYIHKCLNLGIIKPEEEFEMIGELKYDGISVEAEIMGDRIITALSRGDTGDNIATDLTPILQDYIFPNAKEVPKDLVFGMKFEAIITKRNLERLGEIRGKKYKNCRNAIIGLFGSSDAYKFVDYITLIPLSTSLDMSRRDEINFINKYYSRGQYNRHVYFYGNYISILFQVKQFTEAAEELRTILPYMIDGVVISFTDPDKIIKLGRENSVNKYSMAIKFNAKKVRTIFKGYTFNIGKSGDVIPMAHFKPCEFIGTIHTKQTIHSYQRFKELSLISGEQIDIEYINDVITYVTKPNTQVNRELESKYKPDKFIEVCPYCGSKIVISDSGKSAKCPNHMCPERQVYRMVDMIDKLGFKDFSEETIRALNIKTFRDLMNITLDQVKVLGPNEANNFICMRETIKNSVIPDYKFMAAMCFENMAEEKWKKILHVFTISELLTLDKEMIYAHLIGIPSIGPKVVESVINGLYIYGDDINLALKIFNIVDSKGLKESPKVVFTGFRDSELEGILQEYGFEVKNTLTKEVSALIAANPNENSGKIKQAKKYGIPIYSKDEFINKNNIILQ